MSELSPLAEILLRCCYSQDPKRDVQVFKDIPNISAGEFCDALKDLVDHHMNPTNELVMDSAKFLTSYKKGVKKESEDRANLRRKFEQSLSVLLLNKYRPE